jgi:1-deoxyxylulose-5-phosphate synthase
VSAPIIGAAKDHRIPEAVAAPDFRLDDEERPSLEAPDEPDPVLGHE